MKKIIAAIVFIIPFAVYHQPVSASPCETQNNTAEMVECGELKYKEADKELNRVWQSLSEASRNRLRQEQKNWIVNRDKKCTQEADETAEGGTMWPLIFLGCKGGETERRTEYLRQFRN
jgi:uncharacterized protein YecT (DUF1311 family)